MKKILYVSELVYLGGGEKGLLYIIEKLNKEKFFPVVLCPSYGPLVSELERKGIRVVFSRFGVAKKLWGFIPVISPLSMVNFFKIIKREKIDLIHSNCLTGTVFSALPAKLLKIPLVWSDHGWNSGVAIQGLLINFFVSKILTVSDSIKRFIGRSGHISPEKIETVHLGIDLKEFSTLKKNDAICKEFRIGNDSILIGMIARFQWVKGHYYFLKAARKIKEELPRTRFLVVGAKVFPYGHAKTIPQEITRWIKEFGLEDNVICTGFRDDIPDILSVLDVLVLPSLRESFGLILVEAMAAGVPVVATRTEGAEDIIQDNVSGLLVPIGEADAISKAVVYLLENKEKTEEIKRMAHRRVDELFNLDIQVERIEHIYSQLIYNK